MFDPSDNNNNENREPRRPGRSPLLWILVVILAVVIFISLGRGGFTGGARTVDLAELDRMLGEGKVQKLVITDEAVTATLVAGAEAKNAQIVSKIDKEMVQYYRGEAARLVAAGKLKSYSYESRPRWLQDWVPYLVMTGLIAAAFYFFFLRPMRQAGGGGVLAFGRSRAKLTGKERTGITFDDVAGIEEAKGDCREIIEFLKNPRKFQRLGGRMPRGILLIGAPGTGKTLLAKAIAGEADVPFFSISGSDFVEMFVGVGASRVRDLFKQAKENSPCIIFLDEIDAVGRKRGSGLAGGGHDEREQTLNAILVEMDGFSSSDQVIVIAATNRADILDHALTRPGRFDRQIYVPLPDVKGRFEILKVHARKIKLSPDADLMRLARGTPMFSGADLEAIINEAALAATMAEKEWVEMPDLEEARDKVRWGKARRSRAVDEKERIAVAFHESGHVLVQSLLPDADPVHKVSIIPRSHMGGATFSLPEKDRTMYTRHYCLAYLKVCYGGRVAEEVFCGDISSGASGDIHQATEIAKKMILDWGMSEKLGFVRYGNENSRGLYGELYGGSREYSERTAETIDAEVKLLMDQAYEEVKQIILAHKNQMEALKNALLKYETLDGDEVKTIIAGKPLNKPTVIDLLETERKKKIAPPTKPAHDPGVIAPDNGLAGPLPQPG